MTDGYIRNSDLLSAFSTESHDLRLLSSIIDFLSLRNNRDRVHRLQCGHIAG